MHLGVLALALLAGCQLFDKRDDQPDTFPAPEPPEQKSEDDSGPKPERDVAMAIDLLQQGRGGEAGALLAELVERDRGSVLVDKLRRQVETPVEELLPGPYARVEVSAGETLSGIALRELGDPMMFYALARLNGIEVPASIPVGTVLRVPRGAESGSDKPEPDAEHRRVEPEAVRTVAEYLALSGERDEALRMLIDAARDTSGASPAAGLLVELTLQHSSALASAGNHDAAVEVIDNALEVVTEAAARTRLRDAHTSMRAENLYRRARELRESDELEKAHETAREAAEIDPSFTPAAELAEELKNERVDTLHNDALVAWRDRDVDEAIRNWETLLEIAPDFEPARVYLERARRLRVRLGEP